MGMMTRQAMAGGAVLGGRAGRAARTAGAVSTALDETLKRRKKKLGEMDPTVATTTGVGGRAMGGPVARAAGRAFFGY